MDDSKDKGISVLLICGGGASSGFMAVNLRKAAKARGLELEAIARSEAEVEVYAAGVDVIMLGPHLAYLENDMLERVKGTNAKVLVMERKYYSTLDGNKALDHMLSVVEG
ncbi:MAG: hypothetical protein LBC43_01070 [Bifidobacteriaceae bacterium]|jgi:PTS system cellobiose-specific IIB component|nr:hypothetical protein [Bifidobacteriaceae bacterium]